MDNMAIIGGADKFWVVTDPTPVSQLGDILFETDMAGLERQFLGGLSAKQNPTIYTVHNFAHTDAQARLANRPTVGT